jgi:polar amino acid transport system substrate-binding protein
MPIAARHVATFLLVFAAGMPASGEVLQNVRDNGRIAFGYITEARPFTYTNESGAAEGYTVALCQHVARQLATDLGLANVRVEWTPVELGTSMEELQRGSVDLLCTPLAPTLSRRQQASFSIPVFPAGNRAVIRRNAPRALRTTLEGTPSTEPVWRGSPAAKVLQQTKFVVVSGTTTEPWLKSRRAAFQVDATIVPVPDYAAALKELLENRADVLFGDRALVIGAMSEEARERLVILDRMFTHDALALALPRGDEDFRLFVDVALSRLYASDDFGELYAQWYGQFDEGTRSFFLWNTIPLEGARVTAANDRSPVPERVGQIRSVAE